jgi:anti-sigma B factor antagonist
MSDHAQALVGLRRDGEALTVAARGEFDTTTAELLRRALLDAARKAPAAGLVVDLSAVTFMDSMGLAAVIAGFQAARAAAVPFSVAAASPFVAKLLTLTGLAALWLSASGDAGGAGSATATAQPPPTPPSPAAAIK